MTKPRSPRPRDVIQLVDEAPRQGDMSASATRVEGESFEAFYRREMPQLLVLARALAGDLIAEDVAQETMLVAYRRWAAISMLESPTGYVRRICAHKAISVIRRRMSEGRAIHRLASRPTSIRDPLSGDSETFWAEVRRLPRRQAQVTALFYALDLPVSEVAATLGCAEGTVKAHLSRARSQLADRLGITKDES